MLHRPRTATRKALVLLAALVTIAIVPAQAWLFFGSDSSNAPLRFG